MTAHAWMHAVWFVLGALVGVVALAMWQIYREGPTYEVDLDDIRDVARRILENTPDK